MDKYQIGYYLIPAIIAGITALIVVWLNNRLQKRNAIAIEHEKAELNSAIKRMENISETKKEISALLQKVKNIISSLTSGDLNATELASLPIQIKDISEEMNHFYGKSKGELDAMDSKIIHESLHIVNFVKREISLQQQGNVIDELEYKEGLMRTRKQLDLMQNLIINYTCHF